jgi:hypothetical protein
MERKLNICASRSGPVVAPARNLSSVTYHFDLRIIIGIVI